MADVTYSESSLLAISSSLDATVSALDRLHQASESRRTLSRRLLDGALARLDAVVTGDIEGTYAPARTNGAEDRRPPAPDPAPFVPLPRRTTHGGPWGPAMREKFTREAIEKGGLW